MVRIEVSEAQDKSIKAPRSKAWRYAFIGLLVIVLGIAGAIILYLSLEDKSGFPEKVKKKADFSIFYPETANPSLIVKLSSVAYDDANNGLSYQVHVNGKEIIVSEQATPDVFSQSGVYAFKLNQAHEYDSFNTDAGEVALTKPSEAGGQTVAWDNNSKGTLILARAYKTPTESEWKLLFDAMTTVN
jgi:hypothetical protein